MKAEPLSACAASLAERFANRTALVGVIESVPVSIETLPPYDAVLVATNHDALDCDLIRRRARLVVDARGVYREPLPNVVRV